MQGATSARVNIEEQRRGDMEKYENLGVIKKSLYSYPEHERDIRGPKLPDHRLPITSLPNVESGEQIV